MTPPDADTPLTAEEEAEARELIGRYPKAMPTAARLLVTLDAARSSPAPAGLDVERLARAMRWFHSQAGGTWTLHEEAASVAAEYARLAPPIDRDAGEGTA